MTDDEELLAQYARPYGTTASWVLQDGLVPRSAAATAELIRAYLTLGLEPSDTFTAEAFVEIVQRLARLEGERP